MRAVESALDIDQKSVDKIIAEDPAHYGPKLSRAEQQAKVHFETLINSGDGEITRALQPLIDLLWELHQRRRQGIKDRDS